MNKDNFIMQCEINPRYVVIHTYGSTDQILFNPYDRDNCTEPYIKLKKRFEKLGYICEGTKNQNIHDCKWLIFWDCSSLGSKNKWERFKYLTKASVRGWCTRDLFNEAIKAGLHEKMILIMYEPELGCPQNYDFKLHEHFPIIFTWDPTLIKNDKYKRIYLPNPTNFPKVEELPFMQKILLVNISSNNYSSYPLELYTERRETIKYFEKNYPVDFDLYGMRWNMSLYEIFLMRLRKKQVRREYFLSYRGAVDNKWEIYPRYKFGLCYENTYGQRGFVTEKIFDCLRANCVPIYFGAPDIGDYVDKDAFVDRRAFTSLDDLGKYLYSVGEAEYKRYIDAGRAYLNSDRFKLFLSENFVETIIGALQIRTPK